MMKWRCPKHNFLYFTPGRCWLCGEMLEPVPALPNIVKNILADQKALTAALQLANTLVKRLL